jgi:hypothetical protein
MSLSYVSLIPSRLSLLNLSLYLILISLQIVGKVERKLLLPFNADIESGTSTDVDVVLLVSFPKKDTSLQKVVYDHHSSCSSLALALRDLSLSSVTSLPVPHCTPRNLFTFFFFLLFPSHVLRYA